MEGTLRGAGESTTDIVNGLGHDRATRKTFKGERGQKQQGQLTFSVKAR